MVPINRKKEDIQRRRIQEQASVNRVELSLREGSCIIAMEPLLGGFICRCGVPDTYLTAFVQALSSQATRSPG